MALNSQQMELIQQALLSGFPTRDHLAMLMRMKLDVKLDAVAEAEDNTLRTFKIITWAERVGCVRRLIDGMVAQMSTNPDVKKLKEASHTWVLDTDGESAPAPDAIPAAPASADAEAQAIHDYLAFLYTRYKYLDFKGMGMADRVPLQLPMADMYVPLKARVELPDGEAWSHELRLAGRKMTKAEAENIGERFSGPQPVLDLLRRHAGLVILGDPGAGKTTFLKYLAVLLALDRGAKVGLERRLPVLVPLSAYATALAQHDVSLQAFMGDYYRSRGIDLPVDQLLDRALAEGRALILLDGLDEVQQLARRTLVVQRVEEFFAFQRRRGNKFVLTSRIVGYRSVRPAAEDLKECTLVDFDADDILLFLEKWTQALEQTAMGASTVTELAAAEEKAELLFALERNPGVRQLAANPLLLTILALMKRQGVLLPERRVQLYDQYVQTLLRHWNLARGLDRRVARDLDVLETTSALAPLALWMQESSPGAGLVKGEALRRKLEAIYTERRVDDPAAAARQLLADARDHASLLLERGAGEFGFIHLTFLEYLAAIAVAQRGQSDLQPVVKMLAQHIDDPRWREVSLLTIGYMGIIQQRDEAASDVLLHLLGQKPGEAGAVVVLAGEAVLDMWPGGVTRQCRDVVKQALLVAMTDSNVPPVTRARAGSLLSALGDPRLGVGVGADGLPDILWLPVPAGDFPMGSNAYSDEQPIHLVYLDAFAIAKYPITNRQYACFVAATGRKPPEHWGGRMPPDELRTHPVVHVNWEDAVAFCGWLSERCGARIRLPTEAEWEKAARGTDGREYPWGGAFDAARCNMIDTGIGGMSPVGMFPTTVGADNDQMISGIGGTSPVGMFPAGESPYKVADMAGNVWEWVNDWYDKDYYRQSPRVNPQGPEMGERRVLRGGSWLISGNVVRSAYRFVISPNLWDLDYGFRCVRSQ